MTSILAMSAAARPTPHERVLRLLSDGRTYPAQLLAEKLRISRATIGRVIKLLREAGVDIEASRTKGYQLRQQVDLYDVKWIAKSLSTLCRRRLVRTESFHTIKSTNQWLAELKHDEPETAQLCVAEIQTAGRGRRGRTWHSPFGSGICMSVSWRFEVSLQSPATLSLVVGVAVIRALRRFNANDVKLKWPNDLLYRGTKIGGMLIDLRHEAGGPTRAVIGLGLNMNIENELRKAIGEPSSLAVGDLRDSLRENTPSRNVLVAAITDELIASLLAYPHQGFAAQRDEWHRYDALKGAQVQVITSQESIHGTSCGIDVDGALLVQTDVGLKKYHSGEVSLRSH